MKVFKSEREAEQSSIYKDKYYLNSYCYRNPTRLCGNWCALFKLNIDENSVTSPYVVLNCKSGVRLYVDEIL